MSLQWLSETCRPGARANSSVKEKKKHQKLWEDSTYNRKFFLGSLNQTKQCLFVLGKKQKPRTQPNVPDVAFAQSTQGVCYLRWWGEKISLVKPWQVVLSLHSRVHLQAVGQESWGSLMIFDIQTSRCSGGMNKTYGFIWPRAAGFPRV